MTASPEPIHESLRAAGPVAPSAASDDPERPRPARLHGLSVSPARAEIEQALALLTALQRAFEADDWFDCAVFVRRVDPFIEEAEQVLRVIREKDPACDVAPLGARLRRYMVQRLRRCSAVRHP